MSKLIIEGDIKILEVISKVESARIRKHGLKVSLNEDKKGEETPLLDNEPKLTAKEVADLIAKAESIEDLKQYKSDERQVARSAYNKKLKELE